MFSVFKNCSVFLNLDVVIFNVLCSFAYMIIGFIWVFNGGENPSRKIRATMMHSFVYTIIWNKTRLGIEVSLQRKRVILVENDMNSMNEEYHS